MSKDPRIAYFDDLAADWDSQEPSAETMVAVLQQHAKLLDLRAGQDLLEVGCGTGKTTGWLVERVAPGKVAAIDFAPAMVEKARRKGIDAEFRCMDVCADDLGAGLYDVIFCFHCFPHLRDQPAALRNFARALRPGGRLIVMHLAGSEHINAFHAGLDGPVRDDRLPQSPQWQPLLQEAGLRQNQLIDREDRFLLEARKEVANQTAP